MTALSAALFFTGFATVARAVEIREEAKPSAVSASSAFSPAQAARNLMDGSGFRGDSHDRDASARTMWHTTEAPASTTPAKGIPAFPAWSRFDFKCPQPLTQIVIWNHNQSGMTGRGFRKTKVYGSSDGSVWFPLSADTELKPGGDTGQALAVTSRQPVTAVIIAAESNWGGNVYGLSEVRFINCSDVPLAEIPLPSALECMPQPRFLHRGPGGAGREITVVFKGQKVYAGAELEVKCEGSSETFHVPADPKGLSEFPVMLPDGKGVGKSCRADVILRVGDKTLGQSVVVPPEKRLTVYVLMHSHVDIGYTAVQTDIAKRQAYNVGRALELIEETREFPADARFKWNLEVFWPVQQFLASATPAQKEQLCSAIRNGRIGIDAMHTNLLTGVCRGEELIRAFEPATELARENGVKVESMMISDVPGLTWGIIPALNQAGVKYISDGANAAVGLVGDRIGYTRVLWENRPFWWVAANGKDRVLYWGSQGGYSFGHHYKSFHEGLNVLLGRLKEWKYGYDIVQMRWTKGDNGVADESVMPAVRDWNARYAYPKVIIATTAEAFKAFEARHGAELPEFKGDFTPYWEDGVPSGAREAGINRLSSDRLVQAETLWALLQPAKWPKADFRSAWDNVLLWSEHTWGANCSVHQPDSEFTKAQWRIKQAFALDAERQSTKLLADALLQRGSDPLPNQIDIFNTTSWPRSGLVTLSKEQSAAGDRIIDASGKPLPSQRLSTGELIVLVREIPPFAARRVTVTQGAAMPPETPVRADAGDAVLANQHLSLHINPRSGSIDSLKSIKSGREWVDPSQDLGLNAYRYLPGADLKGLLQNGPVTLTLREKGPLLASIVAESGAPGCHALTREVRLTSGADCVEVINLVDKKAVRSKEGVHFGFGFNVPGCDVRVNSPLAVARAEKDQIPGACRNWYSVERWIDASNDRFGVTLATVEAPLFEIGAITANLPDGQGDPNAYLANITPSATLYSWVMNNHWHTNYRADQEGPTRFRYAIRPHLGYDPVAASRFGIEATIPFVVAPAAGKVPEQSYLSFDQPSVMVHSIKPGNDGKSVIVRLFNACDTTVSAKPSWRISPKSVFLSDLSERPVSLLSGPVEIRAWSVVTMRIEW